MITESVEIKRYNAIRENEKSGFSVVDGEIYECYCYEKIVNEHPEFFFVKLEKNKENKNGFWISSDNNLYYQSDEIDLGEFDILGFDKEGILNWWEITRQNTNFNIVIDKIFFEFSDIGFHDADFSGRAPGFLLVADTELPRCIVMHRDNQSVLFRIFRKFE